MKRLFAATTLLVTLLAVPAAADDRKLSFLVSAQWLERTGENDPRSDLSGTRFDLDFQRGAGLGLGLNWFFSDHFSLEAKTSLIESNSTLRIRTSPDSAIVVRLGRTRTYPTTGVLQYHFTTSGDVQPYIGAGTAYTFVQDVRSDFGTFEFNQDAGLVLNVGLDIELSEKWNVNLDAKYVPLETSSEAQSPGVSDLGIEPIILSAGFRYKF